MNDRLLKFDEIMTGVISEEDKGILIDYGFFNAPASIKYHGNYEGGLLDHSLEVTKCLIDITQRFELKWLRPESPYIVGMLHDLCKVDDYVIGDDGKWTYNPSMVPGHGQKSVDILSGMIDLTEEEILCIRYHMGAYVSSDWSGYDESIKKYETVMWTHHADMYASKVKNV